MVRYMEGIRLSAKFKEFFIEKFTIMMFAVATAALSGWVTLLIQIYYQPDPQLSIPNSCNKYMNSISILEGKYTHCTGKLTEANTNLSVCKSNNETADKACVNQFKGLTKRCTDEISKYKTENQKNLGIINELLQGTDCKDVAGHESKFDISKWKKEQEEKEKERKRKQIDE